MTFVAITLILFAQIQEPVHPSAIGVGARLETHAAPSVKSAKSDFDHAISDVGPAIFEIVACGQDDTHRAPVRIGSAFLISRKHRLIATAAHVADESVKCAGLVAIRNGSDFRYKIDRVWYSPDVLRRFDIGLHKPSQYPTDGDLVYPTDDVAVLRLAGGGPGLPEECVLAGDAELYALTKGTVATIGYRKSGRSPEFNTATLTRSVGYTADRLPDAGAAPSSSFWIRTTEAPAECSSGSPIFLRNGKVVAIRSMRLDNSEGNGEWAEDMRADIIRKVLRYHEIERPSTADHSPEYLALERDQDRSLVRIRRAVRLSAEGESMRILGREKEAIQFNQTAISLVPDYAAAYLCIARVVCDQADTKWDSLTTSQKLSISDSLAFHAKCAHVLMKNESLHFGSFNNSAWFFWPTKLWADSNAYHFLATGDKSFVQANVTFLDRALEPGYRYVGLDNSHISTLIIRRADARWDLGDLRGALEDFKKAAELTPENPIFSSALADFLNRHPTQPPE
jgi:hypothetical protein